MNIYDEMLNKYASFLGYEGKIKSDGDYLMDKIEKLKIIFMVNDDFEKVKKSYKKAKSNLGRTVFVCHSYGSAYVTEGNPSSIDTDINMLGINRIYKDKEPCICFMIDGCNNTYEEISINDVINIVTGK